MTVSWLKLLGGIALQLPAVKEALGTTLHGLERDPKLLKFVESFQKVDQQDCIICIGYRLARMTPPHHWCPTRENAELCGCGKRAVRDGELPGMRRRVCEEFPGCIPKSKSTKMT